MMFLFGVLLSLLPQVAMAQTTREQKVQAKVVAQEAVRIDRAQRRKASRTASLMFHAQRRANLLERTASIAAWQERSAQKYDTDVSFGKYAHLYAMPAWPLEHQFFYQPGRAQVIYTASRANRGFRDDGGIGDIAELTFGKRPLIKDTFVASSLATASDALPDGGYEFLTDLADTPLLFTASHVRREARLSYAMSFWDHSVVLGVCMPLVEQMRHLRMWPDVSTTAQAKLRERDADEETGFVRNEVFRELYGINVETYIDDVLAKKGMRYEPHVHQFSVGDVDLFFTTSLFSRHVQRVQLGGKLTIPVAKRVDERFFYPLELGNGGFIALQGHASVLGNKTKFGYPHAMMALNVAMPATVRRRVPRRVVLSGVSNLPNTEVYGEELSFDAARDVDAPETTIASFAQQVTPVTMRPGVQIDMRLGTVVTPCVIKALQVDLYYHLHLQTGTELHQGLPDAQWYAAPLTAVQLSCQHQLGCQLTYQPDAHVQLTAGLLGTVAGVSAPATWASTISLSYQW